MSLGYNTEFTADTPAGRKSQETLAFKKAIERIFHVKRPSRGRPPKGLDKYRDVHIRLHPKALEWARAQARQRGIGYQTFINELLLHRTAGGHADIHSGPHK